MNTLFEMPAPKLTPFQLRLAYENQYYPVADRPAPHTGDLGWFWDGHDKVYRLMTVGPFSKSGKTFWAGGGGMYAKDWPVTEFIPFREGVDPPQFQSIP